MGLIYRALHVPSGRCYIGKTTKTLEKRRWGHEHGAKKRGGRRKPYFAKFLYKHMDEFEWQILKDGLEPVELDSAERFYIAFYHANEKDHGFNLTAGGEGGIPNLETRKKLSESHKGQVWTDEARKKVSAALKGRKLGPHSEERKRKLSESQKGKKRGPRSEEVKRKISEGQLRRIETMRAAQ